MPGYNTATKQVEGAHVSLTPFVGGCYALHVIVGHRGPAWILELQIADDTPLEPDPSGEDELYGGRWMIYRGPLAVTVSGVIHISNVHLWETERETRAQYEQRLL